MAKNDSILFFVLGNCYTSGNSCPFSVVDRISQFFAIPAISQVLPEKLGHNLVRIPRSPGHALILIIRSRRSKAVIHIQLDSSSVHTKLLLRQDLQSLLSHTEPQKISFVCAPRNRSSHPCPLQNLATKPPDTRHSLHLPARRMKDGGARSL
jgi:hypothetical protein